MKLLVHFVNVILWYLMPLVIVFILSYPFDFSYYWVIKSGFFSVIYTIGVFIFSLFYIAAALENKAGFLQFIRTEKL